MHVVTHRRTTKRHVPRGLRVYIAKESGVAVYHRLLLLAPSYPLMNAPAGAYSRETVDHLLQVTTLQQLAEHCGYHFPEVSGTNVRMKCPCCDSEDSSYGQLSIDVQKPHTPFQCFSCGVKGNRLKLAWILTH